MYAEGTDGRGESSKIAELQAILEEGEPEKPELVPFDAASSTLVVDALAVPEELTLLLTT